MATRESGRLTVEFEQRPAERRLPPVGFASLREELDFLLSLLDMTPRDWLERADRLAGGCNRVAFLRERLAAVERTEAGRAALLSDRVARQPPPAAAAPSPPRGEAQRGPGIVVTAPDFSPGRFAPRNGANR